MANEAFWRSLDELVAASRLVIDRPKGSRHPRHPGIVYVADYGYLDGTRSMDGAGIDVWRGSREEATLDALIATVDLFKRDSEIKLLLGCTEEETRAVLRFHNESDAMKGVLIRRCEEERTMERILVLCDDLWHPAEVVEAGLQALTAACEGAYRFDIVRAAKDILTPERLSRYRAVVSCKGNAVTSANTAPWFEEGVTEVGPREFERYVRAGGGFLALHASLSFREADCPEYARFVGATFVTHPPRCRVDVRPTETRHPVTEGVEPFSIRDEHYQIRLLADDAQVFLKSCSGTGGEQVAGYARELGEGRLCALTPGHTLDVWEDARFQRLFANALEWLLHAR